MDDSIKGFNSRLDEIQAAILQKKLKYLDSWNNKRRELAHHYNDLLGTGVVKPKEMEYARHVYHLYVIRSQRREELQAHLEKNGVGTLIHYPVPVHKQEAYSELSYSLPVSESYASRILSLPIYPELTLDQVKHIAALINDFEQ